MGSRFFFLKWPPTSSPLTWCSNLPGNSSLSGDGVVLIFTRFFLPLQQANFTPLYLSHNSQLFRCPLFTSNPDPVSGQDLLTFPCLPASPNTHWIHTGMKSDDSFHPAFHRKWPIRLNQAARHQFRGANSAKIRGTVFKFEATFFLYCSNDTDGVKFFLSAKRPRSGRLRRCEETDGLAGKFWPAEKKNTYTNTNIQPNCERKWEVEIATSAL